MKQLKYLCLLCGGMVALTACSSDDAPAAVDAQDAPLAMTAEMATDSDDATRATTAAGTWTVGDLVAVQNGATVKKYKVTDASAGKIEGYDHSNTFFWNTSSQVSQTVFAWCYGDGTYNATHKELTIANPQVDGTAQAVDLLWAPAVTFPYSNRSTTNNKLVFYHQLAKFTINVKRGTNTSGYALNGCTLGSSNIKPKGTFSNPSTTTTAYGSWSVGGTAVTVTPYQTTTAQGYEASYTAVIFPQTISGGLTINVALTTLGNITYNTGVTAPAAGYHYTYNITLDKLSMPDISATIKAWTTPTKVTANTPLQ